MHRPLRGSGPPSAFRWPAAAARRSALEPGPAGGGPPERAGRRFLFRCGAAFLSLVLAGLAYGGQADDGDWLRRLQERFDATRSFRARFVQEYDPRGFSRPQREGGVVTFRRPGRIRWEYEWPERKLAVCDGTRVWIYYPQEQRVEVEPLAAFDDGAPAVQILLGRWKLWERFRLTALERHGAELTLHLEPTPELSYLSEVRLSVASADLTLRALEAVEPGGNVLRYLFEDWQEGIDAPEELFRFQPPAGTRLEGQP